MINKQRAGIWGAGGTGKRIKEMIDEKLCRVPIGDDISLAIIKKGE